jgi:hypothetical protein
MLVGWRIRISAMAVFGGVMVGSVVSKTTRAGHF